MSTVSWLSGDDLRWGVLTLLVQLTLLLGATIGVAWGCRRRPAATRCSRRRYILTKVTDVAGFASLLRLATA